MISKNLPEDVTEFVVNALKLYLHLPETPLKASANDRQTAANLHTRGIGLATIESALLLGSVRRLTRSPDLPPLAPVRSLAYFLPVIEEILGNPIQEEYLDYLRRKTGMLGSKR